MENYFHGYIKVDKTYFSAEKESLLFALGTIVRNNHAMLCCKKLQLILLLNADFTSDPACRIM